MNTSNLEQIKKATQAFLSGQLVAMPTETVYGLAAPYNNQELVTKIFTLKQRPLFDPLIVHVSSVMQAKSLVKEWTPLMEVLTTKFWPGPLTIVVEKSDQVKDLITSGLTTVGIRMPLHPVALALIENVGIPLAAPSANLFGKTSPTQSDHVREYFSDKDVFLLEGGSCSVGIESTILGIDGNHISFLRPGTITKQNIVDELPEWNLTFTQYNQNRIIAPGQVKHHYMPKIPIFYKQHNTSVDEIQQLIKSHFQKDIKLGILELSPEALIAARQLYAKMRELSDDQNDAILFQEQTSHLDDKWFGILDRLKRASTYLK